MKVIMKNKVLAFLCLFNILIGVLCISSGTKGLMVTGTGNLIVFAIVFAIMLSTTKSR